MNDLSNRRTMPSDDPAVNASESHTAQFDRDTRDDDVTRATNNAEVRETGGNRDTDIFVNDYERSLPEHYQLVRLLGRGGMSEVFLAEDDRLGRPVAIKFLNPEFRRQPERMRRFHREARAASALNHPNILTIHDIGENHGVQFIVSEYVEGETLSKRIAKESVPIGEAVAIAKQIVSALGASHKAGIVHRDVKPDNIMLRPDGGLKVLDFGLAKESSGAFFGPNGLEARTLQSGETSPGLILGTPQYMSPEQARGKSLDHRTDIFSFGVIFFEMLTGEQPFPGSSMVDVIAAVIEKEPVPLEKYIDEPPPLLKRIIEKSLRKDREDRYAAMEHLLSDLNDLEKELVGSKGFERDTARSNRETHINTVELEPSRSSFSRNVLLLVPVVLVLIIAGWLGSRYFSPSVPGAPATMRTVPITSWSSGTGELVAAASFSPDAKLVAFAATKSGSTEIWVKPVVGGEPIQVTKNGFYNQYPIWSPNGEEIAYFSSRADSRGIWRVSYAGGQQTQIASGVGASARPIKWTPNGKIIYQDGSELFAFDEKTNEKRQLTEFTAKGIKPRRIQLSPDEKSVAYSFKDGELWKIVIAALGNLPGEEIAMSKDQIDYLAFDPKGESVVYSAASDGGYQVFKAAKGVAPVALSNGDNDHFVQDVSFDGAKILYGSVSETSDLWTVNVNDGKQNAAVNDVASEFWAESSPDGKNLAYQSVSKPDRPFRGAVKTVALGDQNPIVISPEGYNPVWSPDGNWVAYFRRSESGVSIWRSRASGGDAQQIADGAIIPPGYLATPYVKIGMNHILWSPDSTRVVYTANIDGRPNIWIASADGSQTSALSTNLEAGSAACCAVWTSDGRSLVFFSEIAKAPSGGEGKYALTRISVENSEQKVLFESPTRFRLLGLYDGGKYALIAERADPKENAAVAAEVVISSVSFESGAKQKVGSLRNVYFHNMQISRDARSIAFVARNDNLTSLSIVPVSGGAPRELIAENDPKVLYSSVSWSPDGRTIVFGKQTRTNLISMLSN